MTEQESQVELKINKRLACINLEMLPCKLAFFFNSASVGSVFPFLNLFYVSSGLTASKAGLCSGIENCFSMIAVPLWGAVIDSTKYHKLLLIILGLATALTKFSKPWVVMFVSKVESSEICFHNSTNVSSFNEITNSTCEPTHHLMNPGELFCGLVISGVLSSIFYSGMMSYTEGTTVKVIFTRGTKQSYGAQKLFAPIGFAVGSLLAGVSVDHYYPKNLSHFTAAFYVYLPCSLLLIPILYILTCQAKWDYAKKRGNANHLLKVFKSFDNKMFAFSVIISGLCLRTYTEFVFLFMDKEMHSTKTLMSLTMVAAMASELIIYPFSSRIIMFCGGPIPCIILGIFSYFPRFMLISYCTNPWFMLPIQLFHGIGMSLSWAAQVEHTYHIFPKEATTTALGIIASLHFVGSSVVTNMLGGGGGAISHIWRSHSVSWILNFGWHMECDYDLLFWIQIHKIKI